VTKKHVKVRQTKNEPYIGGFVEHEQGRFDEEGTREGDAHAPPAGKVLGGPDLHLGVEPQAKQNAPRARLSRRGANLGQLLVHFSQARVQGLAGR
jgi:hypothetical protein